MRNVSAGELFVNYHNLTLKEQEEFFANILFNLKDKFGNLQANTNMNVHDLSGLYSFDITTDEIGNATISNIKLPTENNNPTNLDFAVEVKENSYLKMFRDTIWNLNAENLFKNYDNLKPEQQEFFANLAFNLTDTENNLQTNTSIKVKGLDNAYSFNITTNANGNATILNIQLPAENEITAGNLDFAVEIPENENTELFRDTLLNVSEGTINKNYKLTKKQEEEFFANLTFNLMDKFGNIQANTEIFKRIIYIRCDN